MTRRRVALGDRGRVPFALVGVLLVVSTALFAAGVGKPAAPPEPAVDLAVERTTADARATLRQAVAAAGVAAASDPVITPANTTYGRVLDREEPFRDALRIRIYLAARERFRSIGRSHRDVATSVTLPATGSPEALARARDRVTVERVGPGGAELRVTLSNVTVTAERGGRVVGRERVTLSVRVASPVLTVHDRVTAFQRRLDAGIDEPGLGARLSRRLYALAWARGYAQYGGAPIDNVVANRHVGVLANGALLDVQRSVFGERDPDGRRAHRKALAAVALREVTSVAGLRFPGVAKLVDQRLAALATPSERRGIPRLGDSGAGAPAPNETVDVSVGESATTGFVPFTESGAVNETIDDVFEATVRTVASTAGGGRTPAPPERPGAPGDWELVADSTRASVTSVSPADGPAVSTPAGYHHLHAYERAVTLQKVRRRVWVRTERGPDRMGTERGRNRSGTERGHDRTRSPGIAVTKSRCRDRVRATVAVVGRHAATHDAPDRPIRTVHEPAGPFGGPNLADVGARANETVVAARGGPDRLAAAAARGRIDGSPERVHGAWPGELSTWAYADLAAFRERVRNVSVAVPRAEIGTFEVNPPARLATTLRERRTELVGVPATYPTVAGKARIALRNRYLDAVIRALEERARQRENRQGEFAKRLRKSGVGSLATLRKARRARRVDAGRDPGGDLELVVDGAPPYLTLRAVDHGDVAAVEEGSTVHPLVAENTNVFTVPFADLVDGVLAGLFGKPKAKTSLRTAARTLGSVGDTAASTGNETVAASRSALRRRVRKRVEKLSRALYLFLLQRGVGDGPTDTYEILDDALSRWSTPRGQALAFANRSVVDAVVAAAAAHGSTSLSSRERDRFRVRLRRFVTKALDSGRAKVAGDVVTAAAARVKDAAGNYVESTAKRRVAKRFNRSLSRLPAGMPVAPVPGYWYATTNAWFVTVQGRYERFAVEAPRRTAAAGDASLSYVRDGSNVTLDVDGDGTAELLGTADRVSFSVETGVTVVVPPGGSGVGDVNGDANEVSPGWPYPGPPGERPPAFEPRVSWGEILSRLRSLVWGE
ncbi:MAG: hypothetical protein ABEJ40_05390 [Haloarculaceae archaeon]